MLDEFYDEIKKQYPLLWKHQIMGVMLAEYNRRYNFFYETRTGKTLMMIAVMHRRLKMGLAKRCLVICPATIVQAWLSDVKNFPELKVVAFYGTTVNRCEALHTPAHIIIWATEQVANNLDILKQINFHTCVFDESSKIKNYNTQIAKATLELSSTIPSWYNLSATPAPNGKHEYYMQMRCLDPYVFSTARGHFVEKYFDNKSRNRNYEKLEIKWNMEQEFMDIIEDYSLYVDQSVMPTAGKEWHIVPISLGPEASRAYKTMCEGMYAEVQGITITAEMAAAMRSKLNQIASGFIMDTEAKKENAISRKLREEANLTEIYRLGDTGRIRTLETMLSVFGDAKCVIWANYVEEFRIIESLLGSRARYIRGGTTIAYKEESIREFKQCGLQYLVCHPLSVGLGINLTEAHIAIYYSLSDSWEAFKQSSERIYGHIKVQPNKCHYYILQAVDTVNELIYDNIANKRDASTGLLDHLKARAMS